MGLLGIGRFHLARTRPQVADGLRRNQSIESSTRLPGGGPSFPSIQGTANPTDDVPRGAAQFMLPDPNNAPARTSQQSIHTVVATAVSESPGSPIRTISLGSPVATRAAVPLTAVYKNGNSFPIESEVARPRHISRLYAPTTDPRPYQDQPESHLCGPIPSRPYRGHDARTTCRIETIHRGALRPYHNPDLGYIPELNIVSRWS